MGNANNLQVECYFCKTLTAKEVVNNFTFIEIPIQTLKSTYLVARTMVIKKTNKPAFLYTTNNQEKKLREKNCNNKSKVYSIKSNKIC